MRSTTELIAWARSRADHVENELSGTIKENDPVPDSLREVADRLGQLAAENAKLRTEAAAIRGAIEQLAVSAGRPPHWRDHFVVLNPDGGQHAVPWEWAEPPFQLVKQQMDAMGDFGTRAVQGYYDANILRPDAQRWQWLKRQREVRATRSYCDDGWTLSFAVWSGRALGTKLRTVSGTSLEECVDTATAAGEPAA